MVLSILDKCYLGFETVLSFEMDQDDLAIAEILSSLCSRKDWMPVKNVITVIEQLFLTKMLKQLFVLVILEMFHQTLLRIDLCSNNVYELFPSFEIPKPYHLVQNCYK